MTDVALGLYVLLLVIMQPETCPIAAKIIIGIAYFHNFMQNMYPLHKLVSNFASGNQQRVRFEAERGQSFSGIDATKLVKVLGARTGLRWPVTQWHIVPS